MNLRENNSVVDAFSDCMRRGEGALHNAPGLLLRIINENMWQRRIVRELRDKEICFSRFEDFVTTGPWEGLGETMESVKLVCGSDPVALDAIDRVTQNPHGKHLPDVDNVNVTTKPDGNSKQAALRRLRAKRPDLHSKVLAKELSPHAAMVLAGFRKKTVTVELTVQGVWKAFEKLPKAEKVALVALITKQFP